MTSAIIHKAHIAEHIQAINDAVAVGLDQRPATIGLHASACSISLLELYLHVIGKISTGTIIKHEWFKQPMPGQKVAPLAERKIEAEFKDKDVILSLMYSIEECRNSLIYGKPTKSAVQEVYTSFQKLHDLIKARLKEKGEEIE